MSESTADRIVAARRQAHIDDEAYAIQLGLPLNGRYYCGSCYRFHEARSRIGEAHTFAAVHREAVAQARKAIFQVLP